MNVEGKLIFAVKQAQRQIEQLELVVITLDRAIKFANSIMTDDQKARLQEFLRGTKRTNEAGDGQLQGDVAARVGEADDRGRESKDASGPGDGKDGGRIIL